MTTLTEDPDSYIELDEEEFEYYTHIPNAMIRDFTLSSDCFRLLTWLLSNKLKKFQIKISYLKKVFKPLMGKNKLYDCLNEAIEKGYIKREYFIVENLRRCKYFVSKRPKFLEISRRPENGDPENGDPENRDALINNNPSSYEEGNNYQPKDIAQSAKKSRTAAPPRQKTLDISFSFEKRDFTNISEADLKDWKEIYTEVNVNKELKEMIQWVLSNPSKCKGRSAWRKFIVGWLKKSQEKIVNRQAYQQQKKSDVLERHKGFQQDNTPDLS